LNSGLSCEDVQIPLALVKPAQYVLFDVHGFAARLAVTARERLVAQVFRSHLSLALVSATVCHCKFQTASGPALARHKRAGRIEERDGKLYAMQSTGTMQRAGI